MTNDELTQLAIELAKTADMNNKTVGLILKMLGTNTDDIAQLEQRIETLEQCQIPGVANVSLN